MNASHVHICEHPLVKIYLSQLRDASLSPTQVRELCQRLITLLAFDLTKDIEFEPYTLTAEGEEIDGARFAHKISVVGVLRGGIVLIDGFLKICPEAQAIHLGIEPARNGMDLMVYYEQVPSDFKKRNVFVLDSAISSGHTLVRALETVHGYEPNLVRVGVLAACREGVERVQRAFPDTDIYVGAMDYPPTENGEPLDALGKLSDRMFGTGNP